MSSCNKSKTNIIHVPCTEIVDENKSLAEHFLLSFEKYKHKIAQTDTANGNTETFGELLKRSISLAQALQTRGILPDDVISICCYNNMDYTVVIVASIFLGNTFSIFDVSAAADEISHCMKIVSPAILFCESDQEERLHSCLKQAEVDCEVVVFDQSDKFISMDNFIQKYKSDEEFEINSTKTMEDTGCISFTSGTSGLSKGAQLSNYGLYNCANILASTLVNVENMLIFTLPYWVSNTIFCIYSILKGSNRIILRKCDFDTIMKIIQDYKVHHTFLNQHTLNDLISKSDWRNYDTSTLINVYFGGSKISYNQIKNVQKYLPHTTFIHGYGFTEAAGMCFNPKMEFSLDANENISIGNPLPGLYYKIVDVDTDEILGPNKLGELRVKYKGIMNGYLNQPEVTAQAFDEDGFFKTGDVFFYDENYNFFIVDRIKEIFKFRGWHISPAYIENTIRQIKGIKECVVIPKPHDHDGELPTAVIVLQENVKINEEDIIKHVKDSLSDIYHLRGGVKFIDSIPKTSTGKPRRNQVKNLVLQK